jgi:hypothetical protein
MADVARPPLCVIALGPCADRDADCAPAAVCLRYNDGGPEYSENYPDVDEVRPDRRKYALQYS